MVSPAPCTGVLNPILQSAAVLENTLSKRAWSFAVLAVFFFKSASHLA